MGGSIWRSARVRRSAKGASHDQQAAEVVADGGEHGVAASPRAGEVVSAHAVLALEWPMTGSTAARRRSSRLMCSVTPRFCGPAI